VENGKIYATIHITLDKDWKAYSKDDDNSDNALSLDWSGSENIQDIKIIWTKPTKYIEKITDDFQVEIIGYKNEVKLPLVITAIDTTKKGHLELKAKYNICNKICIPQGAEFKVAIPAVSSALKVSWLCLIIPLLFAFIGGLILNIMPCVLPVLSLKILGIAEQGGNKPSFIRKSFIASALGIITSFIILAFITVLLKNAGMAVGWGVHFQQPIFIIILTLVISLFSANLWGLFEIRLPSWLDNIASKDTSNGIAGHFITGVFTTVLATPCSAPFLGTAIGFALTHGAFEIFLIFTVMGIGLAFPFITVAIFPKFASKLPKAGAWMLKVKYFLGAMLALTALWLVWVLCSQVGTYIAVIIGLIFIAIILVLHFIKTALIKNICVIALFIIGISIPYISVFESLNTKQVMKSDIWQEFSREQIPELIKQGNVVVVNVTADWCITCKANKLLVLNSDKVKNILKSDGIVAMQADWTNPNEAIRKYLQDNERYGIPFNIVYGKKHPEGAVLSELLTENELITAIEKAR